MKHLKYTRITKVIGVILFTAIIIISCTKETPTPPYIGTWAYNYTYLDDSTNISYQEKIVFTLTSNRFTETYEELNSNTGAWISYLGAKGILTSNGITLYFGITDAGITSYVYVNNVQTPTGVITYFNENSDAIDFNNILNMYLGEKSFNYSYSVSGQYLYLTDSNNVTAKFTKE
jgi:hypothetical protein